MDSQEPETLEPETFRIIFVSTGHGNEVNYHKFLATNEGSAVHKLKKWLDTPTGLEVRYVSLLRNPGPEAVPRHTSCLRRVVYEWGLEVLKSLADTAPVPDPVEYLLSRRDTLGESAFSEEDGVEQILSLEISPRGKPWRLQVLDALKDYSGGSLLQPCPTGPALPPLQPAAGGYGQLELF